MELTDLQEGVVKGKLPVDSRTHQPYGLLHGGASVVLAETLGSVGSHFLVADQGKGAVGVDAEEASHLMGNLDFPAAVAEIGELSATLRAEGSPKVGVVGFCMGGALTLGAASKAPFDAAAPFYGVNFDLLDAAALKDTPVQGHFGKLDEMVGFSDPTAAAQLEAVLKAAGNDAVDQLSKFN